MKKSALPKDPIKKISKKPSIDDVVLDLLFCPKCGMELDKDIQAPYCEWCGQSIDWRK